MITDKSNAELIDHCRTKYGDGSNSVTNWGAEFAEVVNRLEAAEKEIAIQMEINELRKKENIKIPILEAHIRLLRAERLAGIDACIKRFTVSDSPPFQDAAYSPFKIVDILNEIRADYERNDTV